MPEQPKVNTGQHEQIISEGSKQMVGALLDLAAGQLNHAIKRMSEVGDTDPLSLERFIHNADTLTTIADRVWDLGEKAYDKSNNLYTQQKGPQ